MNAPRDIFIFVNGILTLPSDQNGWTDRAARWIDERWDWVLADGIALEYFTGPTIAWRSLKNRQMVRELVRETEHHDALGAKVRYHLVGHSNGCDIICSALPAIRAEVVSVTLIAGAVEHDFWKNNLNEALSLRPALRVQVLCSAGDAVLKWLARPSRWLLRRAGYGYLGYQGAVNKASLRIDPAFEERVSVVAYRAMGHGDYFEPLHFPSVMRLIEANAGLGSDCPPSHEATARPALCAGRDA
jgi:hypothetical protein